MVNHTYDSEADALYIQLAPGDAARTEEVGDCTLVDLDPTGALLGIEVLHPARTWPLAEILRRYHLNRADKAMLQAMYPDLDEGKRVSFESPDQEATAVTHSCYASV